MTKSPKTFHPIILGGARLSDSTVLMIAIVTTKRIVETIETGLNGDSVLASMRLCAGGFKGTAMHKLAAKDKVLTLHISPVITV